MTEIILNEHKWCEDMLAGFSMGVSPYMTLMRLGRYYHEAGEKPAAIRHYLGDFILRCNPMASLLRWDSCIENSIKNADTPLVLVDHIPIYREELDKIQELPGLMQQRLMFTLLCLAKFRNAVNPLSNGWVSYALKDVFRMEGSQLGSTRQYALINDLYRAGFVELGRSVDSTSVRVTFISQDGDEVMQIRDFRNLGGQYVNHVKGGFICCQRCGLTVRKTGRRQKYCRECAKLIDAKVVSRPAAIAV